VCESSLPMHAMFLLLKAAADTPPRMVSLSKSKGMPPSLKRYKNTEPDAVLVDPTNANLPSELRLIDETSWPLGVPCKIVWVVLSLESI